MLEVVPRNVDRTRPFSPAADKIRELEFLYKDVMANVDRAEKLDDAFLVYMLGMVAKSIAERLDSSEVVFIDA